MTDQEARAVATIIAGSQLIHSEDPTDPRFSGPEMDKVGRMTRNIGYELLARYGLNEPVSTEWQAKRYILEEYYD